MRVPPHPEWHKQAACHGVNPRVMVEGRPDQAKRYCQQCTVVVECLNEALDNPQLLGVWGGLTAAERIQLRRRTTRRTA